MPHASDCAHWANEPCDCMFRIDACDAYKEHRDRQLEALESQTLGALDVMELILWTNEGGKIDGDSCN